MLIPNGFMPKSFMELNREDYENSPDHAELQRRLRKTLYYGRSPPSTDRPSLPMTEIAVEFFQGAAPREFDRVDTFIASNIGRRACVSPCSMMLGMIYIERLKNRNPEYLQKVSSSDLFLISMMMASKYLYDEGVDEEVFNDEWAESAKVELEDLNELERNFLDAIDWNLFTKADEFWRTLNDMEQRIAWDQGLSRGFFTYMDLVVLTEDGRMYRAFRRVMLEVCKVLVVCSMAYVAGALTMIGSTFTLMYMRQHVPSQAITTVTPPAYHIDMGVAKASSLPKSAQPTHFEAESEIPPHFEHKSSFDLDLEMDTENESSSPFTDGVALKHTRSRNKHLIETSKSHMTKRTKGRNIYVQKDDTVEMKQWHVPGFLTLVLIKDTVLQFVAGVHGSYSDKSLESTMDSDSSADLMDDYICTCGCCPVNKDHPCQNMTIGPQTYLTGSMVHASQDYDAMVNLEEWWRLSRLRNLVNTGSNQVDIKKDDFGNVNQLGLGHGHRCSHEEQLRCCCPRHPHQYPWQQVVSKVHSHFHDVMVGFGTASVGS